MSDKVLKKIMDTPPILNPAVNFNLTLSESSRMLLLRQIELQE